MVQLLERKVVWLAFISRLIVIGQLILCSWLPKHNADIFNPPVVEANNLTALDKQVLNRLSGFLNWDSRYFHFITNHGYKYQNTLVFLPLFPLVVRLLSCTCFYPLQYLLSYPIVTVITGIVLNNVCFVFAAKLLYRLGCHVVGDNSMAYKAALIFCFNPASVFFSVLYSESVYFFLSLNGLLLFRSKCSVLSSVVLGLTTLCRSNGVLNALFVLHRCGYRFCSNAAHILGMVSSKGVVAVFSLLVVCCFFLLPGLFLTSLIPLPFLLTQVYSYYLYCRPNATWDHAIMKFLYPNTSVPKILVEYGRERDYVVYGQKPNWCNDSLPVPYSAIQSSHWNVGLLRYYEVKQLPNFALAVPVILVAIAGIVEFAFRYSSVLKTLGLVDLFYKSIAAPRERWIVTRLTPYVLHLIAILIVFIFTVHIQVITRLIFSSSPCIYWVLGYLLCDRVLINEDVNEMDVFKRFSKRRSMIARRVQWEYYRQGNILFDDVLNFGSLKFHQKFVLVYILVFFLTGIYMHGSCLPWT